MERINSDLANTLGNLVNRTISMSNKYFGGVVAEQGRCDEAVDGDLKAVVTGTYAEGCRENEHVCVWQMRITEIFGIFKRCNKYIDETEPWVLAKDEAKADRLATVLYNLVESICHRCIPAESPICLRLQRRSGKAVKYGAAGL